MAFYHTRIDLLELARREAPTVAIFMDISALIQVNPPYERFYHSIGTTYTMYTQTFPKDILKCKEKAHNEVLMRSTLHLLREVYDTDEVEDTVEVTLVTNANESRFLMRELTDLGVKLTVFSASPDVIRECNILHVKHRPLTELPELTYDERKIA